MIAEVSSMVLTQSYQMPNPTLTITTATTDKPKQINLIKYAMFIMQNDKFKTFIDTGEILIYKDGIYNKFGEQIIREKATKLLSFDGTKHKKNEIVDYIKNSTYTYRSEFDKDIDIINVKNGLLNIKTKELRQHTPDYLSIARIPVSYDSSKDCPNIRKFLTEVLENDDIPAIEELAGYCLYRSYAIEKAFMFNGGGSNGKSVCLGLITCLLGKDNCSAVDLQSLDDNRFAIANLYGKFANISADINDQVLTNTNNFKKLTGKDPIHAEHKGQHPFDFYNFAKLIFSANKLPPSYDESDAFYRRMRVISFLNQFVNENDDKDLINKLITDDELSGFLNIALKGLERLLKNGEYSNAISIKQTRMLYQRLSDSVAAFIQDCCIIDVGAHESKQELYRIYNIYCHMKNLPCKSDTAFFTRIKKYATLEDSYRTKDGIQEYCFNGIKLMAHPDKCSVLL